MSSYLTALIRAKLNFRLVKDAPFV